MNRLALLLLVLPCFAAGCSKSTTDQATGTTAETDFRELAGVYEYLAAQGQSPPRNLQDLRSNFSDALLQVIPKIENGDYVVAWGVGRTTSGADGQTILAHEKDAAQSGGVVLFRNGTVKRVTAQEFAAARKAR